MTFVEMFLRSKGGKKKKMACAERMEKGLAN
jgi:hypothetical protein